MRLAAEMASMAAMCLMLASCLSAQESADLYVSPEGNDAWTGKLAAPNADGTDGPLATFDGAQDAARALRPDVTDRALTVQFRGGVYSLDAPIVLTPEDSGTENAPTVYAAYPGEQPVFSGGSEIGGWQKGEGELWTAKVQEVEDGDWYFQQLFVNGERRTRARTPNDGYLRIADTLKPLTDRAKARGDSSYKLGFKYTPGDIERWDNLDDVQIILYHSWTASLHWIKELREETNEVLFTNRSGWPVGYWDRKERYHLENYFEALDSPGEWYLNRETGVLYYWPVEGEDMTAAHVVAPRIQHLVQFRGDSEIGLPVSYVTLNGLSFQHAEWDGSSKETYLDGQAAVHLSAAVDATGARNCAIERCEIAHVGEYAVILGEGCQNNRIFHCHIHDMGGGGVRLGMTSLPPQEERQSSHNTVDNCFIHDGGHVFRAGIGVWVGRSSYNTISHNEICDFYYSGCSVGWSWGYAPSTANHNIFEYNHIHNLGKGVLSDMGGIYSLGISPGTVERFNLIHDVYSYSYGGWGLYTDEGSTGIVMESNICYNCKTGAFHQHYGRDNIIRNNILAFSSHTGNLIRSRQEEHSSFTAERNIVLSNTGMPISGNWSNGNYTLRNNLYWDTSGEDFDFDGYAFEDWQELGRDEGSIVADPLFVDAENHDFRLKENSPAFKIGYQPFDISSVGLYGEAEWVAAPKAVVREVIDLPAPEKPKPIADDFEDTPAGEQATNCSTSGEEQGASIRVTDERAAGGKHSLKFTDAPGLEHNWQPHLVYRPRYSTGIAHLSFDVRVEPGAIFWHEWRDSQNPYQVGPSLRIEATGALKVGGKTLMTVPHGRWTHMQIDCRLGRSAETWTLSVAVQDGPEQTFEGLANGSPNWRRFRWLGFVSEATEKTVFYIDNVKLEREK